MWIGLELVFMDGFLAGVVMTEFVVLRGFCSCKFFDFSSSLLSLFAEDFAPVGVTETPSPLRPTSTIKLRLDNAAFLSWR